MSNDLEKKLQSYERLAQQVTAAQASSDQLAMANQIPFHHRQQWNRLGKPCHSKIAIQDFFSWDKFKLHWKAELSNNGME